jgi:hypothetical protein
MALFAIAIGARTKLRVDGDTPTVSLKPELDNPQLYEAELTRIFAARSGSRGCTSPRSRSCGLSTSIASQNGTTGSIRKS